MKFSIIIPVYNAEKYLRQGLDSVLDQTESDWECICVDDGSTDGSGKILDEYAAHDARFRVVHQKNAGVTAARKHGLACAKGEYVCWLDSDDWIEKDFLRHLYDAVATAGADMAWSGCWRDCGEDRKPWRCVASEDPQEHLKGMMSGRAWGLLWNKIFSRKFILEHQIEFPPDDCTITEDLAFCADFLSYDPRIKYVDVADYHYVANEGSLVHGKLNEQIKIIVRTTEWLTVHLKGRVERRIVDLRKQSILAGVYQNPTYSNAEFRAIFPEVRSLCHFPIGWWHKILFVLARNFHGRILALWLLRMIRKVRP